MRRTGGLLETGKILYLPAAQIRPNPGQPRKIFDPAGLQELAASIAEYGIVQPLTVRRRDGFYELVAGERRLRAARMAGLREVPCILLSVDEAQSGMVALVEKDADDPFANVGRNDPCPCGSGLKYKKCHGRDA